MGEVLRVALVTEGDPERTSGGSLYHRRIADLAGEEGAVLRSVSVPSRRYPLAVADGPAVLRAACTDVDVVVVDSLASATLGPLLLARRRSSPPLVGSVHQLLGGSDVGRFRRTVAARADRLAWRACDALVVPSTRLATDLAAAGVAHPRVHVVPPGHEVVATPAGRGAGDLRRGRQAAVLCVANWLPRKGIAALLDAVARLPDDAVTLHLAGDEAVDPAHREALLARLGHPDLSGRVVRHGVVEPDRIGALYDAADVFAMPSTEEPYGIVYGEAMAHGLPVVGWDAGNLPNLVADDAEGRVLAVGDVAALAAALGELADDETLRKRLGAAALERAAALPTWQDTARGFVAACRDAVAASAARRSP